MASSNTWNVLIQAISLHNSGCMFEVAVVGEVEPLHLPQVFCSLLDISFQTEEILFLDGFTSFPVQENDKHS